MEGKTHQASAAAPGMSARSARRWRSGALPSEKKQNCRTRPYAFAGVWCEILDWLQQHPDAKAAELLDPLMARYTNRYSRRQLRTLQRRVRQWRIVVAKQLAYASA